MLDRTLKGINNDSAKCDAKCRKLPGSYCKNGLIGLASSGILFLRCTCIIPRLHQITEIVQNTGALERGKSSPTQDKHKGTVGLCLAIFKCVEN